MTTEQHDLEGQPVNIAIKGVVELPQLDVSKYVGRKAKIEKVETFPSKEFGGYFLKVSTAVLDKHPIDQNGKAIKDKEGNPVELRATKLLGLTVVKQEDGSEVVGWGAKTNTGVFMAKYKAEAPQDLVGKEVQVTSVTSKKDGKDYLTFN
jgi:hypothetical protein